MGSATAVGTVPATDTVVCDQAVFTSARSATGEGYRVIAASPGLQAVEKVEITRRSPSHGGLCDEDDQAVALEAYALPSKRYCVAYCCYAGCEHTARGGQRVYTHAVLLDRQAWRRFQANPVAVHAALAGHVESTGPVLKPANRLDKIALPAPRAVTDLPGTFDAAGSSGDMLECALATAADLMAGRSLVLLNAWSPFRLLEKIVLSLPLEIRETLDASVGVRFSPARRMRLVIGSEPEAELQRRIGSLNVQLQPVGQAPRAHSQTPFEGWERLLRRWWREGRRQDIQHLTAELCKGVACDALDRIATICEDIDALAALPAPEIQKLLYRYTTTRPATAAEQTLVQQLLAKARDRLASQAPAAKG